MVPVTRFTEGFADRSVDVDTVGKRKCLLPPGIEPECPGRPSRNLVNKSTLIIEAAGLCETSAGVQDITPGRQYSL